MKLLVGVGLLAVVVALSTVGLAQTSVPEPEFNDTFAELDAGKLSPLERQTATIRVKSSGFISVNMKTSSEIPGAMSIVRFQSGHTLEFVVRSTFAATPGVDPNTFYTLHRLDTKKKTRGMIITTAHGSILGATANGAPEAALPLTFSRYGSSSFKITPGALPPGEYALKSISSQAVFCFGID